MTKTSNSERKWAYDPVPGSKSALFLELAQPDTDGFADPVSVADFKGKYRSLQFGNGGDWCRESSSLAKYYNVERRKEKGRITHVVLWGLKKQPSSQPIPDKIRKSICAGECSVLAIGTDIQADHRDGRRDDPRLSDPALVTEEDFQPLSQSANSAKRQHCKKCRETNNRFDAKRLGYSVSQTKGNGKYRGTCVGCYWHDPIRFNYQVSENYKKKS